MTRSPIVAIFLQHEEYGCIAKRVDTWIHALYREEVPNFHYIKLEMINSGIDVFTLLETNIMFNAHADWACSTTLLANI